MFRKVFLVVTLLVLAFISTQCGELWDLINSNSGSQITSTNATNVFGQTGFTQTGSATSATTLKSPTGIFFYDSRLFVSDSGNHRVLRFNAYSSGTAANVVGQSGLTTGAPNALATGTNATSADSLSYLPAQAHAGSWLGSVSGTEYLIIPDTANHRVLIYKGIPTADGADADVVIGQPDKLTAIENNTKIANVSADEYSLSRPTAVYYNNGRLYVVDSGNNRVLIYEGIPTADHTRAYTVIGQSDFNNRSANYSSNLASQPRRSLDNPTSIWVGANYILVADSNNNRGLVFSTSITTGTFGHQAIGVVGQADFTTNTPGSGNTGTASILSSPVGIASNNETNVALADKANNRVLVWNSIPTGQTSAGAANAVLGQINFTENQPNGIDNKAGDDTLNNPSAIFMNDQHLFVADTSNNRILRFEPR
ncbi:MAG TPA: hypothetical protein VJB34_07885 [Bdellovibrionota bacterium]|nr:hypothetical protein [Bdellovibrionota bacterium]